MGDIDAFVAHLRYELRNPINTILGYSQLLLEEGDLSPLSVAERHDLEGVADAGKQLLQTIGAMLDPAAVTDGIEEYAFRLRYATRVQLTTIRGCVKTLLQGHVIVAARELRKWSGARHLPTDIVYSFCRYFAGRRDRRKCTPQPSSAPAEQDFVVAAAAKAA